MQHSSIDWQDWQPPADGAAVTSFRRRASVGLAAFAIFILVLFARLLALEVYEGEAFRRAATAPEQARRIIPGLRGQILTRDGTILAEDRWVSTLEVHYRFLERPPNRGWLKKLARERLDRKDRGNPKRLSAEMERVAAELRAVQLQVADQCKISAKEWEARRSHVQRQVEGVSRTVNDRRREQFTERQQPPPAHAQQPQRGTWAWARQWLEEALDPAAGEQDYEPVIVAEELQYHTLLEEVPPEVARAVADQPHKYPGMRIGERVLRRYPQGSLAAHVVGHLGRDEPAGVFTGRMGVEQACEDVLGARPGEQLEWTDHRGQLIRRVDVRPPQPGKDVRLTLDARLQRSAEGLLESALIRRPQTDLLPTSGGAALVMDVETGEILAAASAPRFDPGMFSANRQDLLNRALARKDHPLFDRVLRMALPPGSVYKIVTSIALLESGVAEAEEPFVCQGFLQVPQRERCALFIRQGIGHGPLTLRDALAQSCNVYFFFYAQEMGPLPLVEWSRRLGFGRATQFDLPGEVSGHLPVSIQGGAGSGEIKQLAIGQGALLVTPLQVARLTAAVANGGHLLRPHVIAGSVPRRQTIPHLDASTLADVREGLKAVVASSAGTAHPTVHSSEVSIAGKTGTAQNGSGLEHAWFAGYAPADDPRLCVVVVLEHAGNAGPAAGPVVRRLIERAAELGYLGR